MVKDLHAKTYKLQPVRRVMIPKPGAGERAARNPDHAGPNRCKTPPTWCWSRFEADLEPDAYGYRPRRSAHDAIQKVHKLPCDGYTDVVDADLSKDLDTIPHWELLKSVARRIMDRDMLRLIKMWLKVPIPTASQ